MNTSRGRKDEVLIRGFQARVEEMIESHSLSPVQDVLTIKKKGFDVDFQAPPSSNGLWQTRGTRDAGFLNASGFGLMCRIVVRFTRTKRERKMLAMSLGITLNELEPLVEEIRKYAGYTGDGV
jgi:hypothetical protein